MTLVQNLADWDRWVSVERGVAAPHLHRATPRRRGRPFADSVAGPMVPLVVVPRRKAAAVDVTYAVTAAIAYAIWEKCGGSDLENWYEAEHAIRRMQESYVRPRRGRAIRTEETG